MTSAWHSALFKKHRASSNISKTVKSDACPRPTTGAVDVYISTGGIANPAVATSHIVALQKIGVTDHYVANVDYEHLAGHTSLYVSVRGASCVGGTSCGADYVFGSCPGPPRAFKRS